MAVNLQPKFERGKTYDGRRGRRKYKILGIFSDGHGRHTYTVQEHVGSDSQERKLPEDVLLELARLRKRGDKVFLSASQIGAFRRCKRRWAFTYINGEIAPTSPSQAYGTEVHAVLEQYLRTGTWQGASDAVACAKQGEHLLPPPRDRTLGIEQPINVDVLDGKARFTGFIDLVIPPRATNALEITDHKTTKDLRYAETSEDLKENVQANIYSKWAMDKYQRDSVLTRWRYYCSRPSKAKAASKDGRPRNMGGFRAVTRVKSRDEVEAQWALILENAAEMVELSNNANIWANDVEPNEFACGDYGGCPFREQCNVSTSSLGALVTQVSRTAHTKKTEGKVAMGSLMDIINKNKSKKASTPPPREISPAPSKTSKEGFTYLGAKGVNPPPVAESKLDPALTQAAETPIPDTWVARLKKGQKPRAKEEKAWRAKQEVTLAKATKAVVEKTEQDNENGHAEPIAAKAPTHGIGLDSFWLFVDCLPAKGVQGTPLSELLRPMKNAVQEMKEVPYWNLIKFREGETLLAACLEQQLNTNGKPQGVVLADSFTGEWKACGDVLMEMADVVVKGGA